MKKVILFSKKYGFSVLFLIFIFFMFANYLLGIGSAVLHEFSGPSDETGKKTEYIDGWAAIQAEVNALHADDEKKAVDEPSLVKNFENTWHALTSSISSLPSFVLEDSFLKLNASFCRAIGMGYIPGTTFVKLDQGMLTYVEDDASLAEAQKNIEKRLCYLNEFAEIVKQEGIDVTYINVPNKSYALMQQCPIGLRPDTLTNPNRYVAQKLAEYGIPCVNVWIEDGVDRELFYKTDHHWKIACGISAAKAVSDYLNQAYAYNIDTGIYDDENYEVVVYEDVLLGSIGTNSTGAFVSAEDMEVYYPKTDMHYRFAIPSKNIDLEGGFDIFINKQKLDDKGQWPFNAYAAYIYANSAYVSIQNESIEDDHRVLIIKDSFANVVVPYLAQSIGHVDVLDIRDSQADYYSDSVIELIKENQYDNIFFIASEPFDMHLLFVKE